MKKTAKVQKPKVEVKKMDFPEAMRAMMNGEKITRVEWADRASFGLIKDGFLELHLSKDEANVYHSWTVHEADINAKDWIILS